MKQHTLTRRGTGGSVAGLRVCIQSALLLLLPVLASCSSSTKPGGASAVMVKGGAVALTSVEPGAQVSLVGKWLFKPSYALRATERPESPDVDSGYLSVPVPQLLTRIQWWLDDSEDFKKWEDARLKALGFDTDKSDDGWYRLWIEAPALPAGRHVYIEFDGVAMKSTAYLNGVKLGDHAGMFSRFSYDLTPHLKPGKNLLAMHVSMEKIPQAPESNLGQAVTVNLTAAKVISMSKGMFGPLTPNKNNRDYDLYGIWQPAKLVVRGGAKIEDVFFKPTADLSGFTADVEASSAGHTGPVVVRMRVIDPKDSSFQFETRNPARFNDGKLLAKVGGGGNPTPFKRWTPANPYLYKLQVTLETEQGQVLDTWRHNVGFRTFEAKGNQLLLNGKPYFLRGANQLPYGKNPFSPELARKLITYLHDNNINSTRTHATPWNEAWLDAADEIGLAVSVEGIRPWAFAGNATPPVMPPPAIFQHWLMENEDVVKRCRNHPSVFMFTVGNEMLLRDAKSIEKWKLLSEVTKQTRRLAGGLPVICSSDYVRDPAFYESTLKPAGIDDGDIDDMHRYYAWYSDSPYVLDMKFDKEAGRHARPLIGQEFSTGYPDLDNGLPVWRYTRDLATPLAWVGRESYPPSDPATFLEYNRVVTKRLAEKLRSQRGNNTSGFSLFSAECWFSHSYDPKTVKPYPVVAEAKRFWAPLGLAMETSQRRFYSGDTLKTNVLVTNDDTQFRDYEDLRVHAYFAEESPRRVIDLGPAVGTIESLPYYATRSVPVSIELPKAEKGRRPMTLVFALRTASGELLSSTTDTIEVFPRIQVAGSPTFVKGDTDLSPGSELRNRIESGATVTMLAPGKSLNALFPDDILDMKVDKSEFGDISPIVGTPLAKGLKPTDLRWWARHGDAQCFIATQSHRLKPGSKAKSLIDFTPAHSYISAEKLPEQFRTVFFEIPLGKGRLWVCDLDILASQGLDPVADQVLQNIIEAAADPKSTSQLPVLPSHAEIVKTVEAQRAAAR